LPLLLEHDRGFRDGALGRALRGVSLPLL